MARILDDIRYSFNKGNNMVRKLLFINIGVFLLINLARFIARGVYDDIALANTLTHWIFLPADLSQLILQPWSLFTYMFVHEGLWHILFNLLWLYFLGNLFQEYLGNARLLRVYIYGGLGGGMFYLLLMNLLPGLRNSVFFPFPLHGASASVLAVIVGIATLLPNYQIRVLVFNIKLKYIAFFLIVTSFLGVQGNNPGGNLAHLGGILVGWLYVKHIQTHSFLDRWESAISSVFRRISGKKSSRLRDTSRTNYKRSDTRRKPDQAEIDAILDKISRSGYDSLTQTERETLFMASKDSE